MTAEVSEEHSPSKVCRHCKISKPFSEYRRARLGLGGVQAACKGCMRVKYRVSNNRRSRKWAELARGTPQRKAVARINQWIRRKRLPRGNCAACSKPNAQAHHHRGYEPPNDCKIIWLCPEHHKAWHQIFVCDPDLETSLEIDASTLLRRRQHYGNK